MNIDNVQNVRRVAIVGASAKADRFAYKALIALREQGFGVVPVHPQLVEIEGISVVNDVSDVSGHIDTVTMYVNPVIGETLAAALIALKPRRVIFNPGSECPALAAVCPKRESRAWRPARWCYCLPAGSDPCVRLVELALGRTLAVGSRQ